MTQDQFMGLLRQVVPFVLGIATGYGWMTPSEAAGLAGFILSIGGPVFAIGSAYWSFKANSKESILQAAGQMPEVEKVVLKDTTEGAALAKNVPANNVDTKSNGAAKP